MPTIYDIAKKSGFSPTTVSKVFNDYKEISQKTKDRILEVADELGYVPNLSARSLKTNKSFLIGVVFSEDVGIGLEHQFFSVLLENFRKKIGQYGYDTIFINNSVGDKKIGYIDHSKYRNVDGLIIITATPSDMDYDKLVNSDLKCVTTDIVFDSIPYVMSDNYSGAKQAINYLYSNGHRKIAHLSGPLDIISSSERHNGYLDSLKELNIEYDGKYFKEANAINFKDAYKTAYEMVKGYKESEMPSAMFISADIMAIAAMKAINDLGLKIPEDISIIGFDDIEIAEYSNPALTTVKQDMDKIGKTLAETLYKLINNEEVETLQNRLPVTIIERDTVKNIETV